MLYIKIAEKEYEVEYYFHGMTLLYPNHNMEFSVSLKNAFSSFTDIIKDLSKEQKFYLINAEKEVLDEYDAAGMLVTTAYSEEKGEMKLYIKKIYKIGD